MLPLIPAYSAPSTTNIVNGLVINDTDIKGLVESSNGPNDRLTQLSNNVYNEFTFADTGTILTANRDIANFVDCSGGATTITLPARSSQYKPIYFKKHKDTTYNALVIQCAGSDKIETPGTPLATFTATSLSLKSPDQDCLLVPTSAGWEIAHLKNPRVSFSAYLSTGGITVNAATKLYYNTENWDLGGYYNAGTSGTAARFTPQIAGYYTFLASVYFGAGSSSELIVQLQKNGTSIGQTSFNATGNSVVSNQQKVYLNGTTDYVETIVASLSVNKTVLNLNSVTYFIGEFSHY